MYFDSIRDVCQSFDLVVSASRSLMIVFLFVGWTSTHSIYPKYLYKFVCPKTVNAD